jgi:hypothetical protein
MLVLGCAAVLHAAGTLILIGLHMTPFGKVLLLAAWLWLSVGDWRRQLGAYRLVSRIRISSDGAIEGIAADGRRQPLRLRGGSFVLPQFAWLSLESPRHLRYAELLLARNCPAADWHWLQLVGRQQGRRFGRID